MANIHCKSCDHDRRSFMKKVGATGLALGFAGLSIQNNLFMREAMGVERKGAFFDCALQIFFRGGPSQTDTWDPKPGQDIDYSSRGNNIPGNNPLNLTNYNAISLGVNDIYNNPMLIGACFPNLAAKVMGDPMVSLGAIRSMTHGSNSHGNGRQYMSNFWRGTLSDLYPSSSAVMAYYFQGQGIGIPSVQINGNTSDNTSRASRVPTALAVNAGGGQGNNPVVEALQLPTGVDAARYTRRKAVLDKLNLKYLESRPDAVAQAMKKATDDAAAITLKGDAATAFNLDGVQLLPARDNGTAERLTLAQRLLIAGIPYVSMGIGGNDSHGGNMDTIQRNWGQSIDQGVVAMIDNLKNSGKRVLIVMGGEFGRRPNGKVDNNRDGRDHWGDGFSWSMISVNQPKFKTTAVGDTGPVGGFRQRDNNLVDPVEPKDLGAMIYRSLGFQAGIEVQYDIPMNDREAPPIDRINTSNKLMASFGLV